VRNFLYNLLQKNSCGNASFLYTLKIFNKLVYLLKYLKKTTLRFYIQFSENRDTNTSSIFF